MKKITLFLYLTLSAVSISAQEVWNKRLLSFASLNTFSELQVVNGEYWVSTISSLSQLNGDGDILGQIISSAEFPHFWMYGTKITNLPNGTPYYLVSRLTSLSGYGYAIAHYRPEEGFINQVVFEDTLASSTQTRGPVFLTIDESTLLLLGHTVIRKIRHQADGSIAEIWSKKLAFKTNDAIWNGNQAIFCDALGNFKAIDGNGNLLWEKNHPFGSKSIKMMPDGIVGCGRSTSGEGIVFKLDFSGNLLWSKTLAEAKLNDLTPVTDGGILLTGETDANNWFLIKTDELGNTLWQKSYEKGKSWEIEPTNDGGAVLLWHTINGSTNLARIDAEGNTPPLIDRTVQIKERTIRNEGINATQFPMPGLFFDGTISKLLAPADSSTSPIFVSSPWIGGKDSGGNLHIAATTYGNINSDLRSGIASSPAKDFDRVWFVSREGIAGIRKDWGDNGNFDKPPPFDLLTWPAKGNPHFKQNFDFSLVATNLDSLPAPFIDVNGDGNYNVYDGDYPKLKGDRMVWWAQTDQTIHSESNGQPLGVDIFITLYGYDCPINGAVAQSVFADYQVINRSSNTYFDTYWGQFTDFELGCREDDYIGSLPEANSSYVYNVDIVDGVPGSTCAGGVPTYGEKMPVESVTMLNHKLDFSTYSNVSGGPQLPGNPNEFYADLRGLVCNGQLPTIGGNGCNPGSTDFTNYVFPGNPASLLDWTMCSENFPIGDRRMLNSHGPFTFAAGDTFSMQLAFTFHPDIPHPCPDIKGLVEPTIQQIQQWHDDGSLDAHLDLGSVLTLIPGQSLVLNATQPNPGTTYSWSTGQNTPVITVNQTGEYTVTVTPPTGCAYTETVLVKLATGTSSPTLPYWQVQPNPAGEVLKIVFDEMEITTSALLRNAQGQLVATKSGRGNSLEISVSNLPPGLYWAELWQEGTFLGSRKVVVAR